MKILTISLSILLGAIAAQAQELGAHIPSDVQAVVSLNGANLTRLISMEELSRSEIGKSLLKKLSIDSSHNYSQLSDLGISLKEKAYYFYKRTDSISYHYLLIPLTDNSKFGHLLDKNTKHAENIGKATVLADSSNSVIIYDHQKALVVVGNIENNFFYDSAVAGRYKLPDVSEYDFYSYDTIAMTIDSIELVENEELEPKVPDLPIDSVSTGEEYNEMDVEEIETVDKSYFQSMRERNNILDVLVGKWTYSAAIKAFQHTSGPSIVEEESYLKSLDPKAVATFWIPNLPPSHGIGEQFHSIFSNNQADGIETIYGGLYVHEDKIEVKTNIAMTDERTQSFKKIYSRKINRKFLKYINSEKVMGFMGFAINMEAYLKELPKLLAKSYTADYFNAFGNPETGNFVSELISILLDEEAIGDLIKGDVLLVFTGAADNQLAYNNFIFNAYSNTNVQKRNAGTFPNFLLMLSTDNVGFYHRLLSLAVKKGKVTEENGIYQLKDAKEMNFYILLKDGIVFVSNSFDDAIQIRDGNFEGDISREHRRLIRKNVFMICLDAKNVHRALSALDVPLFIGNSPFYSQMEIMGNWYIKMGRIKGTIMEMDIVMETPETYDNALRFLLGLYQNQESKK